MSNYNRAAAAAKTMDSTGALPSEKSAVSVARRRFEREVENPVIRGK